MSQSQSIPPAAALLDDVPLPRAFETEDALEDFLGTPSRDLVRDLGSVPGDLMILGASGKMGPSLARLARNALPGRRIIAVARFADSAIRKQLESHGIETLASDLRERSAIAALPRSPNVIFMVGRKFGADSDHPLTWAVNTLLPAFVAETFSASRIVAFSTACVYPFVPIDGGGAVEGEALTPPGEYANSCVGRERMFQYFSQRSSTPGRLVRLSYAIDLRYGVLVDVALQVWRGEPVDVTMGYVNVIWQGDANSQALRCLASTTVPTSPLNVSGPERTSIRQLAHEFARRFAKPAVITGKESDSAWLMDTSEAVRLFGRPRISLERQIDWVADWIAKGRRTYDKPTKFAIRDGSY